MRERDGDVATISSHGVAAEALPYPSMSLVASSDLFIETAAGSDELATLESFNSPFADGFTSSESEGQSDVFDNLVAELEDEEFDEAVERLVNEGAARHLGSVGTWGESSEAPLLAENEVEQWMATLLDASDRMLDEIGSLYDRQGSLESFSDINLDEVAEDGLSSGLDAQEFLFGSLRKKFKRAVRAAKGLVKKGVKIVGKLNPIAQVVAALKKAVRPLLRRILRRIIGRLPRRIRPAARKLARHLGISAEAVEELTEAELFDAELAEFLLEDDDHTPNLETERESADDDAAEIRVVEALDVARARLARQLAELPDGSSPIAEMEQFVPAVLAARPLIKLGIKIIGRKRVVNKLAGVMAIYMQRVVGKRSARLLSRQLADSGLKALGFEFELGAGDEMIGTEALVAAAEETISTIAELDEEWFEDEQLLEAEVRDVFAAAAARHLPATAMRSDLVDSGADGEHAVWVPMPRSTSPIFRYKKRPPLRISVTRPIARSVTFSNGETLERRLSEAGAEDWPVSAELDVFELLPGGEVGHLAAFETAGGAADESEFDELSEETAAILTGDAELGTTTRSGRPTKRRVFRLRVPGARVRKRSPFSVRLDLSSTRPEVRLHVRLSERDSHRIAKLAERRQMVQIVSSMRGVLDAGVEKAVARRFAVIARKRKVAVGDRLARGLIAGALGVVSKQLPGAAAQLATAAQARASGATLSFTFVFADRAALADGKPGAPTLQIRPGMHHD